MKRALTARKLPVLALVLLSALVSPAPVRALAEEPPAAPVVVTATDAAGQALVDAGAQVVLCVPATGSVAIYENWRARAKCAQEYQLHEEVAVGMAMGASCRGRRSAVLLKSHGLAKAANALVDAWTMGAEGGLVLLVACDREGRASDTIFNIDALVAGLSLPMRRLGPGEVYRGVREAFAQSEAQGLPVVVLVEDDELNAPAGPLPPAPPSVVPGPVPARDADRRVLCPLNVRYPHEVVQAKLAGTDWRTLPRPVWPVIPEGMPPKFRPIIQAYMPVFDLLKTLRPDIDFIAGDTGTSTLFACPPYELIDAAAYYGGSIPLAAGALKAGARKTWAVTGDWAFTAAGHLGLHEAVQMGLPVKVLILHNRVAGATGGQPLNEAVFARLIGAYSEFVRRVDVTDRAALRATLQAAQASDRLELVVVDLPTP